VLDHRLARLEIAGARARGDLELLLRREERGSPDLAQVGLQRVAALDFAGASNVSASESSAGCVSAPRSAPCPFSAAGRDGSTVETRRLGMGPLG
jgi:hypothetical protein